MPEPTLDAIDQRRSHQYKERLQTATCYCEALRMGHKFLLDEVRACRASMRLPLVLCLDDEDLGLARLRLPHGEQDAGAGWEMIYSADALSLLDKADAQEIIKAAILRLKPGGRLLVANVASDPRIRSCPACAHSKQKRRTVLQMAELTQYVPQTWLAGQAIFLDASGLNLFLEVHRRVAPNALEFK